VNPLLVVFWALIALGLLAGIWAIGIERHLRVVRREPIALPILPAGAKPIRVLHFSDIHGAPWQKAKMAWISRLAKLDVDLVVDTGDNLGHVAAIDTVLAALKPLAKFQGVFVNGSNDYFAPHFRNPFTYFSGPSERISETALDTQKLVSGFEGFGWKNLNNSGAVLEINGTRLGFVGTDDHHEGRSDVASISKSVAALGSVDTIVGVTHAPYLEIIGAMRDAGAIALFAGHTHGGQVCIPGFGAIVTNCDLPRHAAKGLSRWKEGHKSIWLNVCAGLGHSIFAPIRFFCRPEVRLVALVARDSVTE
jgi:predicted MPP superfamily phosphohydrolase